MRGFYPTIAFLFLCQISFGQIDSLKLPSPIDSIQSRTESFKTTLKSKSDSLTNPLKSAIKNYVVSDTLEAISSRLDSIQDNLNSKVDSLTHSYANAMTQIQSAAQHLQLKIDSLQYLHLPNNKYKAKIDSLSQRLNSVQQDMNNKLESIKQKTIEKVRSIEYPPELEDKVSKLASSVGNLNMKTIEARLPSNLNLDKLNSLTNSLSISGLPNTPNLAVPELPKVNGLKNDVAIPDIKSKLSGIDEMKDASQVDGQVEALRENIDQTTKDLNPNSIDKLADSKAMELKEVKALQEASGNIPLDPTISEKEMKTKLKEEAAKVAVDHFADKQQQLKSAMERISKYKQKYSNVKSIADVTKKPRNEMKDKPFKERIVPGLGLQFQKRGNDLLVDFNPYAGFRFTTRITAGAGWNERVPYSLDLNRYNPDGRVYGPRVFGEFKIGKGFSPRLEVEVMNTVVPPSTQAAPVDPENREWVWGAFVGMKKEYKLFKRVKGTASVMTRLFNPDDKSPYADVLNLRFGFEFPMKKKIKTSIKN